MAVRKKRLEVPRIVYNIGVDCYESSLKEFKNLIDEAEKNGATHVRGREESGYYGDTSNYLEFYKIESENDEEYSLRIKGEQENETRQADWERQTYEKLKKKFEG